MLATTIDIIRSGLKADPTLSPADRTRVLAQLRETPKPATNGERVQKLVRRKEAAARLALGLRSLDKLAASGVLPRRRFPGRTRGCGFLEADLEALISGRTV